MPDIDPFAGAGQMLRALQARQVSSLELVEFHLDRIARLNPLLNAIVTLDSERALAAARAAGDARPGGGGRALAGLPVTIKDTIDVAGLPTTGGLPRRKDAIAAEDAPVVQRLRVAGAVVLGKTNVPPYAGDWQTENPLFGRTVNPWDPARTPGGSTGGGAAAVAAGLSPLETGTDLGGSIRVPAAFCGIYGHKPSEGLVPLSRQFPGWDLPNETVMLNTAGPLARTADDLALALSLLAGAEPAEGGMSAPLPAPRHERLGDFRVAVLPLPSWAPVDDEIFRALDDVAAVLRGRGGVVARVQPDVMGDGRAWYGLFQSLLAAVFAGLIDMPEDRRRAEAERLRLSGDEFDAARAAGLTASAVQYLQWGAQRAAVRHAWNHFFRQWDVLLAPAALTPAFPHDNRPFGARTITAGGRELPYLLLTAYPALATLPGLPATAFPAGPSGAGLPLGLQAIGPYREDITAIRFTALLAAEMGGFEAPRGFH